MKNKDKKLIHDIKNKLLVIQHNFNVYKEEPNEKSDKAIEASIDRCFELIKSYVEEDQEIPDHQIFTLEEIISKSSMPHYDKLQDMYNLKIVVEYDLDGDDRKVKGNEKEFMKVRENIVENAVNANANILKVLIKDQGDYLNLIYENDGDVINDDLLNQINSYSYGEELKEFKSVGTKIIKEICTEHGFAVHYDKTDFGTKVTITVPYYS